MKNKLQLLLLFALVGALSGCIKPYDTPEYIDIKSHETAYVIPLEDNVDAGVKFDSEAYLDSKKVALKRIRVPHRWNQTGRLPGSGEWIDTIKVVTVDRTPVTRQWDGGNKGKQALWLESMDSIGFSTGFSVTALIEEGDASKFLYSYKNTSLSEVLDTELRARIQSVASVVSAKYKMDVLRERKNELIESIKADVLPFFKLRGITITTIGQFGGFEYENVQIQSAIDDTFVAQQAKVKNAAMLEAQHDANKRIELEALAHAEAARTKAKGEADGKLSVFKAEAEGLSAVNEALAKANQNPALVELKRIDVMKIQAERWNGAYPQWYMPGGGGPNLLLNATPPKTSELPWTSK